MPKTIYVPVAIGSYLVFQGSGKILSKLAFSSKPTAEQLEAFRLKAIEDRGPSSLDPQTVKVMVLELELVD